MIELDDNYLRFTNVFCKLRNQLTEALEERLIK